MITSIFLLFVAAGIVIGSFVFGFGGSGVILLALAGLSILTAGIAFVLRSHRPSA